MITAAIFPTYLSSPLCLSIPNNGIGKKYNEVAIKNIKKKNILPVILPETAAPVKAIKKGGHRFNPVSNPSIIGKILELTKLNLDKYFFALFTEQNV